MASVFNSIFNFLPFVGHGKDRYTQTKFPNTSLLSFMSKGEDWVDTSDEYKFNLYNTTPHLKAVIDRKALMKANGRWKHYKLVNGEKVVQEQSEYVDLLENPNFLQNGNEFTAQMDIVRSMYGNCIIYVNKAGNTPKFIWNLPTPKMSIRRTGKLYKQVNIEDVISGYTYLNQDGTKEEFETKDIIHLRDPNPNDPIKGVSKIDALMMPISNVRGALGFRNRIITSDAMLGILSSDKAGVGEMVPNVLDDDKQKRINEGFRSRYGMQEGKTDILQTEASVKWQAMSYPTKDLMLFEEVDDDFRAIIDAYGLNANIFSFAGKSTYENMEQGMRLAYRDTIIPEAEGEALIFSKFFGMDTKVEWLELSFDHLDVLKEDDSETNKRNAETIQILRGAGVSPEKISEILGFDVGDVTPSAPDGSL